MDSERERIALTTALVLALAGAAAGAAWTRGLWLALAGALLVVAWFALLAVVSVRRPAPIVPAAAAEREETVQRLLLDASPTPLLMVDGAVVRALNRAARRLFDTDDRVLPPPAALLDRDATHLRHLGRSWRADRVDVGAQAVVALVDVEGEERAAEARASAEMIQVLGHEMLNGLVPIVSLAECGVAAAESEARDPALLHEILTTLARRAEGLRRFTEAYRALARLPPPMTQRVAVAAMIEDLARLFASRWPAVGLDVAVAADLTGTIDRDQVNQAVWALMQNAVEAAGSGHGARVALSARREGGGLAIEVSDNGDGIAPDRAAAIFRPFVTTKPEGTGIGLSLARQIARAHGGTLDLAAAHPATFRISLPDGEGQRS